MIRYLLDTNVISETARPKPDANVTRWLGQLSAFTLSSVGVYELASGIQRLAAGKKREFLEDWLAELLASDCDVLPFDRDAALSCAVLESEARRRGRTIEQRDLLILAIAKSQELSIATRNVAHFRGFGVPVYDPFSDNQIL
ncbi:MAG TPA: PIN domain-containing protein [Thermoanaerobaculia bacterium]|nr:PIN domain-containing protein [Thermoanaerobaculia bacterium]